MGANGPLIASAPAASKGHMNRTTATLAAILCLAQAQTPRPAFEVASVKFHARTPGPLRAYSHVQPAGIDFNNVALKGCIHSAYGMESYRILGGPDWITSERYDIIAKASAAASRDTGSGRRRGY